MKKKHGNGVCTYLTLKKTLRIMRLVLFLLLISIFQTIASAGYSQSTKITLKSEDLSLVDVLSRIEDQSEYRFIYDKSQIDLDKKVRINFDDASLKVVLDDLFLKNGINYQVIDNQVILNRSASVAMQQSKTISGKVTDFTNSPLPGVTVVVKGTTTGTVTDADGNFSLTNVPGDATLVFSFVGMTTQEIPVVGKTSINVTMAEESVGIEEVVAIGYGTTRKAELTQAVSSVSSDDIRNVTTSRSEQLLQGRVAGVNVLPASGSPGSNMQIRIRGTGTGGNSEPIYIVDGMRTSNIDYIAPGEIETIEILKDAASAAIYGAEGANGVIIIKTKTGSHKTSPTITYHGEIGLQSLGNKINQMQMNAEQYVTYLDEAQVANRPTLNDLAAIHGKGTNWLEEITRVAPIQSHSVDLTGGNEKSTYLLSGNIFQQEGVIGGNKSEFNRYTFRLNSDHEINSWLKVGSRLSYMMIKQSGITEDDWYGGIINNALSMDPLTPVIYSNESGLPDFAQQALNNSYPLIRDKNGNLYGLSNRTTSRKNPVAGIDIIHNDRKANRLVGNIFANIKPIANLEVTSRFGVDNGMTTSHSWSPAFWFSAQNNSFTSTVTDAVTNSFYWQWENYATYDVSFKEHTFRILGGTSLSKSTIYNLGGSSAGLFREEDKFAYHDFTPDTNDRIDGAELTTTLASFFGRVAYSYMSKYMFNFTIRRDGSSRLPTNNRWGTFPSMSVGWNIAEEKFFPIDKRIVNAMKVRASWGQNGNLSNIVAGQWDAGITTANIQYLTDNGKILVGAEPANLPNYDLTWETSEQSDIGIDLGLFRNKLSFVADYFVKKTKNLITPGSPPNFVGFTVPNINGGSVKNTGFEFEISYRSSEKELKYEIGLNASTIKNVVTYLNPQYPRIGGQLVGQGWTATAFEKGYPLWYFRGYETSGIFQTQEDINKYITTNAISGYNPKPGEPIVVDVNKDRQITSNDQTYIGDPYPDLVLGATLSLKYKNFDFLAFGQGSIGNKVLLGFNRYDSGLANRPAFFYENRWTGPGSTNDMFAANTTNLFMYNSDLMVFDASFFRIKQLQLGYNLKRFYGMRVYISLDDYFTFTKYPGTDPEVGTNSANGIGIDRGVYPVSKKLMVGITFKF